MRNNKNQKSSALSGAPSGQAPYGRSFRSLSPGPRPLPPCPGVLLARDGSVGLARGLASAGIGAGSSAVASGPLGLLPRPPFFPPPLACALPFGRSLDGGSYGRDGLDNPNAPSMVHLEGRLSETLSEVSAGDVVPRLSFCVDPRVGCVVPLLRRVQQ